MLLPKVKLKVKAVAAGLKKNAFSIFSLDLRCGKFWWFLPHTPMRFQRSPVDVHCVPTALSMNSRGSCRASVI